MKLTNSKLFIQKAFISGEWIDSSETLDVEDPYTREKIGCIPYLGKRETRNAILSAQGSLQSWKNTSAKLRSNILLNWFRLVRDNESDLAKIITFEQGKPFPEAVNEIKYSASYIQWFAEEAKRVYGDILQTEKPNSKIYISKEAIGVVGTITPWNFPSAMLARKVAPALAAGCTIVSKPSELTPYSALALAKLGEEAGIPKGVWNIVAGDYESIGNELCENSIVKKISFTGSTKTGSKLFAKSAASIKKLSLELGGNAPFIVFKDANMENVLDAAMLAKFRNSGQTCVAANRFYVQEEIVEEFSTRFAELASRLKMGSGFQKDVNICPIISELAMQKIMIHIEDAIEKGAKILTGGKRRGVFIEPTVLSDANSNMKIFQEETFGPVAAIQSFRSEDEVLFEANNTDSGLAAYFFTQDIRIISKFSNELEFGMIGINESAISYAEIPFGGIKQSGFGREGSKYGLEEYLNLKYTYLKT
jgi:succinate-semialdehyde dehydrogenase / glutarate-semialdehyde dehydrogenase